MNSFYSSKELQNMGFVSVGENVLISRKASIYGVDKISIGNNVRIDDFCILSGKITLGNNIHISAYTALYGGDTGIILNDFSGISSRCAVYSESDDYSGNCLTNPMNPIEYRNIISGKVILEKHVLVGSGCTILPDVTIKEGTAVGCMSLINQPLDSWGIYAGIPCRKIKDRKKIILKLEEEYLQTLITGENNG